MNRVKTTGLLLLMAFTVTQGLRDVYLASAFDELGFFDLVFLAFLTATLFFAGLLLLTAPAQLQRLKTQWRGILAVNVTTAAAWLCYFGALNLVEPSVVNTVFSGISPMAVALLAVLGLYAADRADARWFERGFHSGIFATLILLAWVVLSGRSGLPGVTLLAGLGGLGLAAASGVIITAESVYAKQMNEAGVSAIGILAVRFVLITAVAAVAINGFGQTSLPGMPAAAILEVVGRLFLLIVAPLFLVQQGLAMTSPLTTGIVAAFAPSLVFMLQAAEGRIPTSYWVLSVTLIYAAFSLLSVSSRAFMTSRA